MIREPGIGRINSYKALGVHEVQVDLVVELEGGRAVGVVVVAEDGQRVQLAVKHSLHKSISNEDRCASMSMNMKTFNAQPNTPSAARAPCRSTCA